MWNLVWHRLMKLCFIWRYTFQHCSDMFKLNKCAKRLNLAINDQPMCIESNPRFLMCNKACKLTALLLAFSAISSFPQLLRREGHMVASYSVVPYLQHCYVWIIMRNTVHNYCCNMNMLGALLTHLHSPSGVMCIY